VVSLILNLLYNVPSQPSASAMGGGLGVASSAQLQLPSLMAPESARLSVSASALPFRHQVAASLCCLKLLLLSYGKVLKGELHHLAKCILDRAANRLTRVLFTDFNSSTFTLFISSYYGFYRNQIILH